MANMKRRFGARIEQKRGVPGEARVEACVVAIKIHPRESTLSNQTQRFGTLVHGPKRFCVTKSELQFSMFSKRLESSLPEFGRAYIKIDGRIFLVGGAQVVHWVKAL